MEIFYFQKGTVLNIVPYVIFYRQIYEVKPVFPFFSNFLKKMFFWCKFEKGYIMGFLNIKMFKKC